MLTAAFRDRTPWLMALGGMVVLLASPGLSWGSIASLAAQSPTMTVSPLGETDGVFSGSASETTFGGQTYKIVGSQTPINNNFGSGSFSLDTVGDTLTVIGYVGTLTFTPPASETFTPSEPPYSGTLLDGNIAVVDTTYQSAGITWYLVDNLQADGSAMANVFGSEVLVKVTYNGEYHKADLYGVVPEPSPLVIWGFLGLAGVVVGAFTSRRRRLNEQ